MSSTLFNSISMRRAIGPSADQLTLAYWQDARYCPHGAAAKRPPIPPVVLFFNETGQVCEPYTGATLPPGVQAHKVAWPRRSFGSLDAMFKSPSLAYVWRVIAEAQDAGDAVMLLDNVGEGAALCAATLFLLDKYKSRAVTLEQLLAPLVCDGTYLARQGTSPHVHDMLLFEWKMRGKHSIPPLSLEVAMGTTVFTALHPPNDSWYTNAPAKYMDKRTGEFNYAYRDARRREYTKMLEDEHKEYVRSLEHAHTV